MPDQLAYDLGVHDRAPVRDPVQGVDELLEQVAHARIASALSAAAAVLAAVSAVVPAAFALRTRPVELAGMRE